MCRSIISLKKYVLRGSVFFTKPCPTNIHTYRSGLIQSIMQNCVFRGNAFPSGWFSSWIHTQARYRQEDCINWVMCKSIISQSRCTLILSILFTNPYSTNIRTCGSGLIQLLTQMHVFRGNVFPGGWFSSWISTWGRSRQIDEIVLYCTQK